MSDTTDARVAGVPDRLAQLEPALPMMMRVAAVPGVALGIVDGDRVVTRAYGVVRAGGSSPVDANTLFEAGSLGKPVFAFLVLRLATDGLIDLDRPLADYLPPPANDSRSTKITARHVLAHTTGWRNWRSTPAHTLTADAEPGKRFVYSGEGFYYLSRVIEKPTGEGILRVTRERLFRPLGMTRSSYLWMPARDTNRADAHNYGMPSLSFHRTYGPRFYDAARAAGMSIDALRHEEAERLLTAVDKDAAPLPNNLLPNVAGSLLTTANDYALFLRSAMADRTVVAWMTEPQVTVTDPIRWGLGVGLQVNDGRSEFWHWGEGSGFKSYMVADPSTRRGVVVFTNGHGGRAVYERIVRAVRGDQPAFLDLSASVLPADVTHAACLAQAPPVANPPPPAATVATGHT